MTEVLNTLAEKIDPAHTAIVVVDMQNDFLHAEGAYGRADQSCPAIAALPARLAERGVLFERAEQAATMGGFAAGDEVWRTSIGMSAASGSNSRSLSAVSVCAIQT